MRTPLAVGQILWLVGAKGYGLAAVTLKDGGNHRPHKPAHAYIARLFVLDGTRRCSLT